MQIAAGFFFWSVGQTTTLLTWEAEKQRDAVKKLFVTPSGSLLGLKAAP